MTASIAVLVARGAVGGEGAPTDRTGERILDAVVLEVAAVGVDKLTIEAIARRARVNRATIYRRFGGLDGLIDAATMREGHRMTQVIAAAIENLTDPVARFVESFVAFLRAAREHPVISRTVMLDPGRLIVAGMADDAALLKLGTSVVSAGIRLAQADGHGTHLDPDEAGQTIAMLFAACVLMPTSSGIDLRTDESVRAYARRTLAPIVFGPPA